MSQRGELRGQIAKTDRLHALGLGVATLAAIDDKSALGLNIVQGLPQAALQLWRCASLDFNGPEAITRQFQDQVDLNAGGRAIETRLRALGGDTGPGSDMVASGLRWRR